MAAGNDRGVWIPASAGRRLARRLSRHLRSAYNPHGVQRWLAFLLMAVGWIFVTTIAAGIARVLRRQ
jgi:hypothetical protein